APQKGVHGRPDGGEGAEEEAGRSERYHRESLRAPPEKTGSGELARCRLLLRAVVLRGALRLEGVRLEDARIVQRARHDRVGPVDERVGDRPSVARAVTDLERFPGVDEREAHVRAAGPLDDRALLDLASDADIAAVIAAAAEF